ncbi:MAG: T9SS type A sorting domain-containing protein [Saprospiraceae bacterium]|nr:T9SS type A sorting domain-containing protein [Saprospiraceae bacterium]
MNFFTKKVFGLLALMVVGTFTYGQTVLWGGPGDPNGEFSGSLNDWTVASNDPDALWVWDADGAASLGAYAGTESIQSPSVTNGAAVFDSDFYDNAGIEGNFGMGVAAAPQLGELISPVIDLTGQSFISLKFNQYHRNFQSSCLVAWSNDGGTTWLDSVNVNETIATNAATPANSVKTIPLFGGGNTSQFRFKFIFDANYYFWVIDDVAIIERPEFDLRLGDFFFSPASYAQPVTQIKSDTMGFSVDVNNIGRSAQDDVALKIQILKGSTVVYTDEINIGTLVADSPDSTYSFDELFVPDMLTTGTYVLRYSISSPNTDFDNTNNTVQQNFRVTSNFYSKDDEDENFEGGLRPGGGGDYFIGNLYTTSQNWVENYQATVAEFGCAVNPDDPIENKAVNIYLLAVNDDVAANWDGFDDQETDVTSHPNLTLLGFGEHTFPATYQNYADVNVQLSDLNEGTPGVPLQSGTRYLLMLEYAGAANTIFHGFNTKINYFQISTVSVSDQWFLAGFGPGDAAILRMTISLYSSSDELALPDNSLTFYPNPANSELTVDLDLEEPTLANVTLADLNGRVIEIDEIENAYKQTRQYDVSNLPNGTYLVRVATKAGTKTKKFVVQH